MKYENYLDDVIDEMLAEFEEFDEYDDADFYEDAFSNVARLATTGVANIRWVQNALNRILGLRLAVDGRMGVQTRNAVQRFQRLAGVPANGVIGASTLAALNRRLQRTSQIMPPSRVDLSCPSLPITRIIRGYPKNASDIPRSQFESLREINRIIYTSQRQGCAPVKRVVVTGHTSTEGSPTYNKEIGKRRADKVATHIRANMLPPIINPSTGNSSPIPIVIPTSRGETIPVVNPERTDNDRYLNRRVVVELFS